MSLWLINKLKYSCGSSSIPFLLLLVNLGPLHTQARRPTTMAMWELSWVENVETFQVYLTLGGERPKGPNNSLWMEKLHVVLHDMLWIRVHGLLEFASCPLLGGRLDANSGTLWQWKQLTMVARVILIFFPTIIFTWNISIFFSKCPNFEVFGVCCTCDGRGHFFIICFFYLFFSSKAWFSQCDSGSKTQQWSQYSSRMSWSQPQLGLHKPSFG